MQISNDIRSFSFLKREIIVSPAHSAAHTFHVCHILLKYTRKHLLVFSTQVVCTDTLQRTEMVENVGDHCSFFRFIVFVREALFSLQTRS